MKKFNPDKFLASEEEFNPDTFINDNEEVSISDDLMSIGEQLYGVGGDAVDLALRGLDYAGGLVRTGGAAAIDAVTDQDLYREGDLGNALVGKAPDGDTILDRAGFEDDLGRTVAGIGVDVATDPLTYLTLGASSAGKLGKLRKLLRPSEDKVKAASQAAYELPWRQVNKSAENYARNVLNLPADKVMKPTDVMFEKGIVGSADSMNDQVLELLRNYKNQAKGLVEQTGSAPINPDNTVKRLQDLLDSNKSFISTSDDLAKANVEAAEQISKSKAAFKNIPGGEDSFTIRRNVDTGAVDEAGDAIRREDILSETVVNEGRRGATVRDINRERIGLNKQLESNYRAQRSGNTAYSDDAVRVKDAYRAGLRDEQIRAMNEAIPGAGDEFASMNKDRGTILSALKGLGQDVSRLENKPLFSKFDAAMAGAANGSPVAAAALAAAKTRDLLLRPEVISRIGRYGYDSADKGLFDLLLRQAAIQGNQENYVEN